MMFKKVLNIYPLYILIIIYLLFSFFTYKDFGITADEEIEYKLGKILITFYTDNNLYESQDIFVNKPFLKNYYHLYPMILSIFNQKGYYEWYHLGNMLFATVIIIFSYLLIYYEYKDKYLAIIAPIAILLTPRFFGDIPSNPKDMPFAVMYFLSICLIYYYSKNNKLSTSFLVFMAFIFGITQSMRIIGYTIYPIFFLYLLLNKPKIDVEEKIRLIYIVIISHFIMWFTWPSINKNPLHLINIFTSSINFTPWNRYIFYFGEFLNREQRPWHYLFTWILITTPLITLILHFISFKFVKKDKLLQLFLIVIYMNLFLYLVMNPIIYNGLRHFLYLLPLLTTTSAITVIKLSHSKNVNFIIVLSSIYIIFRMISLHPFQYTYFNDIAKNYVNIQNNFELDYWGATYKEATEKIIKYIDVNKVDKPKVYSCNVSYAVQYYAKGKFELTNKSNNADFILCDTIEDLYRKYDQKIIDEVTREDIVLNRIRITNYNNFAN